LATNIILLAAESRGSNTPSIRILILNEERMSPGYWLGIVLCVPLSALILMVEWQEGHPALTTTLFHWSPEVLFWNWWWRRTHGGTTRPMCTWKGPLNES